MHAHEAVITEQSKALDKTAVLAIYNTREEAEKAIHELQTSGFDMRKLPIVGKDYRTEEHVVGYYTTGDRVKAWGKEGAFWGGLWGLLFGSAFFFIPALGPLFAAGPVVGWIVGALEGAVVFGGGSALAAALYSIGIPRDSVIQYETQIKSGKYLLITHGSQAEADKAKAALGRTKCECMKEHPCCAG